MKIYTLLAALFFAGIALAQTPVPTYQTVNLSRSTAYSDSLRIDGDQVPVGLFADSTIIDTSTGKAAGINIYVGFSSYNSIGPSTWYVVNNVSDTVAYTVYVKANQYVPLQTTSIIGLLGTYSGDNPKIWIKFKSTALQVYSKTIFVKTRYIQ